MTHPNNEDESRGGQMIFQPISHPILMSVDPVKLPDFVRERERYEIEITEKFKEVDGLTEASYKASVDPRLLRRMNLMEKFNEIAPKVGVSRLLDKNIKQFNGEKWKCIHKK